MRSWAESAITSAIPPKGETRFVTLSSPFDARHFRLAIYNYLRRNAQAPRLTIRCSGCDLIITHRERERYPTTISNGQGQP